MLSLELPHCGDSDEYTQDTIFNIIKKFTINDLLSATVGFFQRTQERVQNSCGRRAISVQATEVLLYFSNAQFTFPSQVLNVMGSRMV